MKLKVFTSATCPHCQIMVKALKVLRFPFEQLDADADEHQNLLDEQNVSVLPFVQLIDDGEMVVWQKSNVTLKDVVNQYESKHRTRTSGKSS